MISTCTESFMQTINICFKGVGKGSPPPQTLSSCSYYKGCPKFIIIEEKQLSAYKLCYAYKNQSLEVSKYMNLALITCNKLDPRG